MQITAAVFRDDTLRPSIERLEMSGPGPGEVLVRMVATGVCHTDAKAAGPNSPAPRPVVLGHEGAGTVEAVGPGVSKVAPGDHVVMTFGSCGRCRSCEEAEPAYCHHALPLSFGCKRPDGSTYLRAADGSTVYGDFFQQSSFASHAIGRERNVVKVRKDAPLEMLGPLGCGVQTGAGAVLNDLRVKPGRTIAIFGVGALGLSAVMAARLAGAGRIIAVDRHQNRLDLARELGAHHAILPGAKPLTEEIKTLLPIGVDYALDTTGVLAVMRAAFDSLAPRGECAFVTSPWDGSEFAISPRHLLLGRKMRGVIEGNSNPDVFIPQLVDWFMDGRFPFDKLVRFYPFADLVQAFHDSETGVTIKPVLRM
jgi:aryl-alcohol dehydrogenase